jgi:hypothetical protein
MRDAFAVLDWIVNRHVHAYLDTAGRPVGEGRSSVFEEVETEMRTCPYPGSRHRHEKPMNASAIQGMPPWQDLLAMMTWLSHRHRARYRVGVTNSNDLARITSAGIMLVDYLALRRDHPIHSGEVPLLVSGVYKVCLGYQLAYLPERFAEEEAPAELPDAAGFLEYLEEAGLLIGEAEVCSCPPSMILQSYEAMTQVKADVSVPQIDGLSIDWDRFDDFAEGAGDMWRELVMFAIRMPSLIPQLDHAELPDAVREGLNTLVLEHGTQLLQARDGLVVALADSVRSMVGTVATPLPAPAGDSSEIQPGTVAATVMDWLRGKAPEELAAYGHVVGSALQLQLGSYEDYETGILERINGSLNRVMKALDLSSGPAVTSASLSQICGRTMRDWASSRFA